MKKLKKMIKFIFISLIVLGVITFLSRFLFSFFWNFDILNKESYQTIYKYWNGGGEFKNFKDCSLVVCLILFPIVWLKLSNKLYKYGLVNFLLNPIIKGYRRFTRPKSLEVEHVSIKNIGKKDKSLDEIISDKLKEKNISIGAGNTSKNIRQQISSKIGEN